MFTSKWLKPGIILLLLFCASCGDPLPSLENIDLQTWKDDKLACGGQRAAMLASIEPQTEKLLSLSEQDIIAILGRPDENELYKRNQKFYYYFLQPSSKCKESSVQHPKKLVIRFNAVGFAKEAAIE